MLKVCKCFSIFLRISLLVSGILIFFSPVLYAGKQKLISDHEAAIIRTADLVDNNLLLNPKRLQGRLGNINGLQFLYLVTGENVVLRHYLKMNGIENIPYFSNGCPIISPNGLLHILSFHEQFMLELKLALEGDYNVELSPDGSSRGIYAKDRKKNVLIARLSNIYFYDFDRFVLPLILYPNLFTARINLPEHKLKFRCMSEFGSLREAFEVLTSMAVNLSNDKMFRNGGRDFHHVYKDEKKIKTLCEIMAFRKKAYFFVNVLWNPITNFLKSIATYDTVNRINEAFTAMQAMIVFHENYSTWQLLDAGGFATEILTEVDGNEWPTKSLYSEPSLIAQISNDDYQNNSKIQALEFPSNVATTEIAASSVKPTKRPNVDSTDKPSKDITVVVINSGPAKDPIKILGVGSDSDKSTDGGFNLDNENAGNKSIHDNSKKAKRQRLLSQNRNEATHKPHQDATDTGVTENITTQLDAEDLSLEISKYLSKSTTNDNTLDGTHGSSESLTSSLMSRNSEITIEQKKNTTDKGTPPCPLNYSEIASLHTKKSNKFCESTRDPILNARSEKYNPEVEGGSEKDDNNKDCLLSEQYALQYILQNKLHDFTHELETKSEVKNEIDQRLSEKSKSKIWFNELESGIDAKTLPTEISQPSDVRVELSNLSGTSNKLLLSLREDSFDKGYHKMSTYPESSLKKLVENEKKQESETIEVVSQKTNKPEHKPESVTLEVVKTKTNKQERKPESGTLKVVCQEANKPEHKPESVTLEVVKTKTNKQERKPESGTLKVVCQEANKPEHKPESGSLEVVRKKTYKREDNHVSDAIEIVTPGINKPEDNQESQAIENVSQNTEAPRVAIPSEQKKVEFESTNKKTLQVSDACMNKHKFSKINQTPPVSCVLEKGSQEDEDVARKINVSIMRDNKNLSSVFRRRPPVISKKVEAEIKKQIKKKRTKNFDPQKYSISETKSEQYKISADKAVINLMAKNSVCELIDDGLVCKVQKVNPSKIPGEKGYYEDIECSSENLEDSMSYIDNAKNLCNALKYLIVNQPKTCMTHVCFLSGMFILSYYVGGNEFMKLPSLDNFLFFVDDILGDSLNSFVPCLLALLPILGIVELFIFSCHKKKSKRVKNIIRNAFNIVNVVGVIAGEKKIFAGSIPKNRMDLKFYCHSEFFSQQIDAEKCEANIPEYIWVFEKEMDYEKQYMLNGIDYSSEDSYPLPVDDLLTKQDKQCICNQMGRVMKLLKPYADENMVTTQFIREKVLIPFSLTVKKLAFGNFFVFNMRTVRKTIEYMSRTYHISQSIQNILVEGSFMEFGDPAKWREVKNPAIKITRLYKRIRVGGNDIIVTLPCFYKAKPDMSYTDMVNNCLPTDFDYKDGPAFQNVNPEPISVAIENNQQMKCLAGRYLESMTNQRVDGQDIGGGRCGVDIPQYVDGLYTVGCSLKKGERKALLRTWFYLMHNNTAVWKGVYRTMVLEDYAN